MKKGEITLRILEVVSNAMVGAAELFEAMLVAGYGASLSKLEYTRSTIRRGRARASPEDFEVQRKTRYAKMLYKLKSDGLLAEKIKNKKKTFELTRKGLAKLLLLRKQHEKLLPTSIYQALPDSKYIIISFDVPEKYRRKRDWLRAVLRRLGLKMIHKSVWIGKIKIPQDFLDDLFKFRLSDFVEIFEISKAGSLRQIT